MAARLPPGEAERRRRARVAVSFSDAAYRHYDTALGYGSAAQWARLGAAGAADEATGRKPGASRLSARLLADLAWFKLGDLPLTLAELKTAFRAVLFIYHPDHGGKQTDAVAVLAAFERLKLHY